jgi:Raf kinase inhibitor-like YbhB/YbcL family protein
MKNKLLFLPMLLLIVAIVSCGDEATPSTNGEPADPVLVFSSSAFADGDTIPDKHTCEGIDWSPALTWSGAPVGTESWAIIFDDPDTEPTLDYNWNHWLVCNLPATITSLAENQTALDMQTIGGLVLENSYGWQSYGGPCPPVKTEHTYEFTLYALDVATLDGINGKTPKQRFLDSINVHKLDEKMFSGTFSR